jgi:flavin reductase (DIM6/NTAB) family NADH-FMN oxidoreductase RutF
MDQSAKKTALKMIPYGLYVLTSRADDGRTAAATVTWVTQLSFEPPLIVVCVKADSQAHAVIEASGTFALNILSKQQPQTAFAFFKTVEPEGDTIGGERFREGTTGAPILESVPAHIECKVVEVVKKGDHSAVIGQVVAAGVAQQPEGRPDEVTLTVRDLGGKISYGG